MARHLPLVASLALSACGGSTEPAAAPPDLVLIVVDTLRADAVGPESSPRIDALARDGVAFSAAFSHAPMTLSAHAALFASRPPFESGVLANYQAVPDGLPLLAEWLGEHGYATHAVVSLGTLAPRKGERALERGFEAYDTGDWDMDAAPGVLARLRERLDALDPDRPFFLFAHFSDPHAPYNVHGDSPETAELRLDGEPLATLTTSDMTQWEEELALTPGRHVVELESETEFRLLRFAWTLPGAEAVWEEGKLRRRTRRARVALEAPEGGASRLRLWITDTLDDDAARRRRYATEVDWVDRHVGALLDELAARGLYEDAVVVFTSDHGEALGERGRNGHVEDLFDEMLHVPLVVKPAAGPDADTGAARAALERARDALVPHQDLAPTLLELAGLPPLPGARGASLLGAREPLLVAQTHRPVAERDLVCLRDGRFKLIHAPEEDAFELYDLVDDPGETRDLFAERGDEHAEWVETLRTIAELSRAGEPAEPDLDADTLEQLEALGYGGGD